MTDITINNVSTNQNTYLDTIKAKAESWKQYVGQLAERFKSSLPSVPKVAQVYGFLKPTAGTPSAENEVAASDSAAPTTPLEKLNVILQSKDVNSLTARVMNAVASVQSLKETQLEWKDSFHKGGTGYIDGVKASDLSKPVMWGIDNYNRPFVALKLQTAEGDGQPGVETIFQRYTDDATVWTSGNHYSNLPAGVEIIRSSMGYREFNVFNKLINGETVNLTGCDDYEVLVKIAN